MSLKLLRIVGIALLIVCAGLGYFSWQQYNYNALAVEGANEFNSANTSGGFESGNSASDAMNQVAETAIPGPSQVGGVALKAGIPKSTIYAGAAALLAGIVGLIFIVKGREQAALSEDDEEYVEEIEDLDSDQPTEVAEPAEPSD